MFSEVESHNKPIPKGLSFEFGTKQGQGRKMSDRYAPQQRKFCKFCNCWFADNKISIESHERGLTHQANVERELDRTRRSKQDLAAAEKALMLELQRIEAAAMRSFEQDAKRDPFARDELERVLQAKARATTRK